MDVQISSAAASDSAVYYCAVRPTVTANPQPLPQNTTSWTCLHPLEGDVISRRCTTSSLSSATESMIRAAVKRTILRLNAEHQLVSPLHLNLVVLMERWLWMILAALFSECKGKDKVIQTQEYVTAAEGDTVTLGCTFETTAPYPYLFWYKQEGNSRPTFILSRFKFGEGKTEDKEKHSSTLDATRRSVPLKIHNLQVSDSAVYYCALRPTVTGNSKTPNQNLWSKDKTILHTIHRGSKALRQM
ncbi:uncharacterized protein KZ484_021805 [Pholidichthys leucotaenia]